MVGDVKFGWVISKSSAAFFEMANKVSFSPQFFLSKLMAERNMYETYVSKWAPVIDMAVIGSVKFVSKFKKSLPFLV